MCVRTSKAFYGSFILDMGRSPGFGSALRDFAALLRLGFPSDVGVLAFLLAARRNSPDRSTKSTRLHFFMWCFRRS